MAAVKYNLGSSEAVYAPGVVAFAINGAHFKKDAPMLIKMVADCWSVPLPAAKALVMKKVPYKVEGEKVVFVA
jgi:hypothetical protein